MKYDKYGYVDQAEEAAEVSQELQGLHHLLI